jgi:hypothetical protein
MIVHVVLFKPRADLMAAERAALVDALTTALREIPSIRRARIGPRVLVGRPYEARAQAQCSHAALLEFADVAGLRAYLEHPAHAALASRFFDAFEEALLYDFDLEEGPAGIDALAAI